MFSISLISIEAKAQNKQIECLATNAYHEARGEGQKGIEAVTQVVLNRVKDKKFGNTPCEVVYERNKGKCQFSWVCTKNRIKNMTLYFFVKDVVTQLYYGNKKDITNGSTYYHARYVSGSWFKRNLKQTTVIGNHVFYREG